MKPFFFASSTGGLLLVSFVLVFFDTTASQPCAGQRVAPSVDELAAKMMRQEEQNQKKAVNWVYDQEIKTQSLDGLGRVKSEKTEKLTGRSAGKMSFFVRASEDEENRSETSFGVGNKDAEKGENFSEIFTFDELKPFYDFSLAGEDSVEDRKAWLLDFEPKKEVPKAQNQEQKVLRNLRGRLWVDKTHYAIIRADCNLVRPTPFAWFDLVSLRRLKIHYETFFHKGKVWLPKSLEVEYLVRILYFGQIHDRQTMTGGGYREQKTGNRKL